MNAGAARAWLLAAALFPALPGCLDETEGGSTPLHLDAVVGTPASVRTLLDAGAAVNARDEGGWTPLHLATGLSRSPAVVQTLLDAGARLDARDERGRTPLHWAAVSNDTPAVVQALLDAGANPAARDQSGKIPWDLAQENPALKGTDAYWRLNEGRFE